MFCQRPCSCLVCGAAVCALRRSFFGDKVGRHQRESVSMERKTSGQSRPPKYILYIYTRTLLSGCPGWTTPHYL